MYIIGNRLQALIASVESEVAIDGIIPTEIPQDELSVQTEDLLVSENETGQVSIDEVDADGADTAFVGTDSDFENEAAEEAQYEIEETQALQAAEIASATFTRDIEIDRQTGLNGAIESLREIRTFIQARPTLEARTVKLLDIAINTHTARFGLEGITIALASLDGVEDETRVEVTEAPVTEVIETAEAVVPVSRENQQKAERRLEEARKAEQVKAVDETHVEAGVDPTTIVEAQEPVRAAEVQRRLDEQLEDAVPAAEGLTIVADIVGRANETGGMGLESLLATQYCLAAFTKPLGLSDPDLTPGVESFDTNSKYQVSQEVIFGKQQEVDGVFKQLAKRFASTLFRSMVPVWRVGVVQRTRLVMLQKRAEEMRGTKPPKGAVVEVSAKNLHQNGKIPSNPAQYLAQYAEMAAFMMGPFHKRAKAAFNNNLQMLEGLKARGMADFPSTMDFIAKNWQDPRKGLPGNLIDFHVPGGRRFFADVGDGKYDGKIPSVAKLAQFAELNVPTRVLWRKNLSVPPMGGWPALQPPEVVKICDMFRAAYNNADAFQHFVERVAAGQFSDIALIVKIIRRIQGDYLLNGVKAGPYRDEVTILKNALKTSRMMTFHCGIDATYTMNSIVHSFITYANRSLKVARNAGGIESFADSVIEVGNMVRGGNSVGRVARVSFESFDFNGQTIQASADKPAYLVRGYRNGEYSAHTAVTRLA